MINSNNPKVYNTSFMSPTLRTFNCLIIPSEKRSFYIISITRHKESSYSLNLSSVSFVVRCFPACDSGEQVLEPTLQLSAVCKRAWRLNLAVDERRIIAGTLDLKMAEHRGSRSCYRFSFHGKLREISSSGSCCNRNNRAWVINSAIE
ncbi:hypothetical protein GOODEAATRI_030322 [Goodea atripinnis]|uniref:Uncharacterized protein n=1 Tax=Goodea atripinnis TaxID=208336 RepID=A0ABV0MM28_9TELE